MRFRDLQIPPGAIITGAEVEFVAEETGSTPTSLVIQAETVDDASAFTSSQHNISNRPRTAAIVSWTNIPAWNTRHEKHQTPDISAVIQEVVSREGWNSGNDLVLIITGTGERSAESYDGDNSSAPLLRVEYAIAGTPPAPAVPDSVYNELINADLLHNEGYTGEGVTVAVIDTGFLADEALTKKGNGSARQVMQYDAITDHGRGWHTRRSPTTTAGTDRT